MIGMITKLLGGPLGSAIGNVAERYFDSKEQKEEFKRAVELEILKNQQEIDNAGSDIIKAEINAGGLAAQWRPILALCFGGVVVVYTVMQMLFAFGVVDISVEVPNELWNLLMVMIGGYTVGRSVEKGIENYKK